MDKKQFLLLFALSLLVLFGCTKNDIGEFSDGLTASAGDIHFEISFVPKTRVETNSQFESKWEAGDEIGVFAVTSGQPLQSSGNYIHNVKLFYDGTEWKYGDGTEIYWNGKTLDFYAYYPYNNNGGSPETLDPTNIAFCVQSDQNSITGNKSNYNLSDLLTAKTKGATKSSPVSLEFSHILAMIQMSVPIGSKGSGPGENLAVYLKGVRAKSILNLDGANGPEVQLATIGNDAVNITMHCVEQPATLNTPASCTYRALVPAQNIAASGNLFLFEHEERQQLISDALTSSLTLVGGTAEIFEYTLPLLLHTVKIEAKGKTFKMGTAGNNDNEPQHEVAFTQNFRMSKYEITNAQFVEFLNDKGVVGENLYNSFREEFMIGGKCTWGANNGRHLVYDGGNTGYNWGVKWDENKWVPMEGYEDNPVVFVTWFGAYEFAHWVGGSLPTEAQWEYACRAGTTGNFSCPENLLGDYAWYYDNEEGRTKEVGTKLPNAWGLYDMHGNVQEWCADWYDTKYGLSDEQLQSVVIDPVGPAVGFGGILRGGWVSSYAQGCRSAYRAGIGDPYGGDITYGFRVIFVP